MTDKAKEARRVRAAAEAIMDQRHPVIGFPDVMHTLECTISLMLLECASGETDKAAEINRMLGERIDYRIAAIANALKNGETP
jgi:hypothetical protein